MTFLESAGHEQTSPPPQSHSQNVQKLVFSFLNIYIYIYTYYKYYAICISNKDTVPFKNFANLFINFPMVIYIRVVDSNLNRKSIKNFEFESIFLKKFEFESKLAFDSKFHFNQQNRIQLFTKIKILSSS